MLAIQLKNYLESVPDMANILIYVAKTGDVRQLRDFDLDRTHEGNIVIDAEYKVPAKETNIERG
jgi:hypothetical protein